MLHVSWLRGLLLLLLRKMIVWKQRNWKKATETNQSTEINFICVTPVCYCSCLWLLKSWSTLCPLMSNKVYLFWWNDPKLQQFKSIDYSIEPLRLNQTYFSIKEVMFFFIIICLLDYYQIHLKAPAARFKRLHNYSNKSPYWWFTIMPCADVAFKHVN